MPFYWTNMKEYNFAELPKEIKKGKSEVFMFLKVSRVY